MLKIKKTLCNNRGIALLITISVTTILVASALEYNRRARFAVISTAAMRDRLTLTHMASSGVHAAMALLVKDKSESNTDSLLDDWANSEKIDELLQEISFEDGKLSVTITDEMGKIQANALVTYPESRNFNEPQRLLWDRFLTYFGDEEEIEDDRKPLAIINSLKDWLDSGDDEAITGLSGAESSYYQDLDPSYSSRNGPIMDLNELLLIKGITPKLYYGSQEKPGISQYLTVQGISLGAGTSFTYQGRININTAELPVLIALLPSENEDLVKTLYDLRQEATTEKDVHDFSSATWYKDIPGFSGINVNTDLITTASDVFRIDSKATLNNIKMTTSAVVQRIKNNKTGQWMCKVLSWKTDPD